MSETVRYPPRQWGDVVHRQRDGLFPPECACGLPWPCPDERAEAWKAAAEEAERAMRALLAERDALKLKRREQFNRWGVEIRYDDQEQMALRLEQAVAERDELRAEVERSHAAVPALTGEVERLKAQVARWERQEIEKASCCDAQERRADKAESMLEACVSNCEGQQERAQQAEAALREMHALLPAVMDALESDAQLDVRRAAFESIQEAYEESHPWGAALRDTAPAEQPEAGEGKP